MASTQPTTDRPRLPIDITGLIASQKQRHPRHLVRDSASSRRVQLPNLTLRAARPRLLVHRQRHARLNDARTDGVDTHASTRELVGHGLREADNGGLAGRIVGRARVGADAGHGGGANDAAAGEFLFGTRRLHGDGGVLGAEEDAQRVDTHGLHEAVGGDLVVGRRCADDAGVGEHDVEAAVGCDGFFADGFHGCFVADVEGLGDDVD